jgi:HAE1 family hydrophobic/amphiphilic exporter-1
VLFFFLRRLRMMLVVNLAVPLSLLIAIAVMFFAGETLNIISLLSLMVCVGLLVDNSVVVAENIDRMHKEGRPRREAAVRGAGEIALAILMSTLTTVIVFLPVSLVEGPGQFFLLRMAIPICVALLASLGVALVCIPLGVYLTLPDDRSKPRSPGYERLSGRLAGMYETTFGRMNRAYGRVLNACLNRRLDMVLAVLAIFAITAGVTSKRIKFVETQQNEEAGFSVDVEMPEEYSFEETEQWFLKA